MKRALTAATIILALALGAAGTLLGVSARTDARHANQHAANVAAANVAAQKGLRADIASTAAAMNSVVCSSSTLTSWYQNSGAAAAQAYADKNFAAYDSFVALANAVDLVCGTTYSSKFSAYITTANQG